VPVTSMVIDPSPLMDPPMTLPPALFVTGFDSPVSIASLTEVSPSTTAPSAGSFSPGFTKLYRPRPVRLVARP
jgi:hypothetical protein